MVRDFNNRDVRVLLELLVEGSEVKEEAGDIISEYIMNLEIQARDWEKIAREKSDE